MADHPMLRYLIWIYAKNRIFPSSHSAMVIYGYHRIIFIDSFVWNSLILLFLINIYLLSMKKLNFKTLIFLCLGLIGGNYLFSQTLVTGTVVDAEGVPLFGVNIVSSETTTGTITDLDGTYEISVGENGSLIFSYTGYDSQTISVNGQSVINVTMKAGSLLDEVVVVGYGKEKKSTLTGAVSTIDNEQLTAVPVANSANLLAGRVPGVMTRQNSGLPGGEETQIRIRGYSGSPLTLVDGVQMDFSRVDPNDIESITVLKDAAAAVYGARAGNGVLLVTTKRGKNGKPKISYSGSYTLQSASRFFQQVDPGQYVELVRESNLLDGNPIDVTFTEEELRKFQNGEPGYEGGDWVDGLIKNQAPMQQHSLSVSGGSENISYFTSFGYTDQESYFRSRDYDYGRYNARSNIDAKINDNLSFNLDLSFRFEQIERASNDIGAMFTELLSTQPIFPTSLPDPTIGEAYSGFSQRNPISSSKRATAGFWDRDEENFRGKLGIKYDVPFITGLSARVEANVQRLNRSTKTFARPTELYEYQPATDTYLLQAVQRVNSTVGDNQFRRTQIYPLLSLEYAREVGNHSFKVLGIAEQISQTFNSFGASRRDLLSLSIPELFIGSTDQQFNYGSSGSDIGRKSYVGRVNYDFQDKYLFEATFRADGNVLFSPERRWGYFPSVSAGWVVSQEDFMRDNGVLEFFKVRASYSRLGDDTANGLAGFDYLTGYDLSGIYLFGQNQGNPTIRTRGLVNPLLTWEKMTTYNLGFEATFLSGRLNLETELFFRNRDGIINVNIEDVPSTFGAALPVVNIDSQTNRGFEISGQYRQRIGDVTLDFAPNFTYTRSRWKEVKSQEDFDDPDQQRLFELDGRDLNVFVGYLSDGIFMNQAEIDAHGVIQDGNENTTLRPGDIKYIDLDGDGEITFRDQDFIGYGTGIPAMVFGMNLGVTYKGFSLNGLIQGASQFAINIGGAARTMFSNSTIPLTYQYENRWQPDLNNPGVNINPNASLPAATQAPSNNNNRNSDFWHRDVTYFRLKNVNLAYDLPQSILGKSGLQSAQVYVAAENLVLLTNLGIYKDSFDPEFEPGDPTNRLPVTKTVAFGVRISL